MLWRVKVGSVVRGERGTRDCTRVLEMIQYTGWIYLALPSWEKSDHTIGIEYHRRYCITSTLNQMPQIRDRCLETDVLRMFNDKFGDTYK